GVAGLCCLQRANAAARGLAGVRVKAVVPVALMFAPGVWPRVVLDVVNATAVGMVEQLKFE
ncbi:MAG: hypothetical protein RMK20_16545, partial [Verrucomicrobiales bacterium]|nr:hypothetical protein [Verrucomicrobiales bacterium]